jgi:soluble lytic murein transglycosylase-like protein
MAPRPQLRSPRRLLGVLLTGATLVAFAAPAVAKEKAPAAAGSARLRNEHPAPPKGVRLTATTARYTVRKGDSLALVAGRFATTVKALRAANGLTSATIHPGQVLQVPGAQVPSRLPAKLPAPLKAAPERLSLVPVFVAAAKEFSVPYDLLMSLAYTESGWQRSAVSDDGAVGVTQLLPMTARWVAGTLLHERGLDLADPEDNIRMSARFLGYLLELTGGSQFTALAAYYQGHVAVQRNGVSAGGRTYATIIMTNRTAFRY